MNDQFNLEKTTYYVLDATGNVMATYDKEIDYANSEVYLKLKDRSIYGSSRVGVRSTDIDILALHNPNYSMKSVKYEIGKRTYELSNHLGNVLSVISDKPIPSFEGGNLVGMLADVRVAKDYSPFGVTLSGRSFEVDGGYRYGFNSMEKDDEVKGRGNSYDFGARMYDSRLGRWWIKDAFEVFYTSVSPYSYALNNPISNIDIEGNFVIEGTVEQKSQLTKVINATKKALATNPYLLERLKLHSGLSEDEINWLLTDNKGPILQFKSLPENEYGDFKGNPVTGPFLQKSVSVDPKDFLLSLNKIFEATDIEDADNRFLLVMIILHEMCHIGDNRNGVKGDVIDYAELEKTEVLKKGFVKEAKTQTVDAKYDPAKWAQGIEVGKGLEVDLTGYSINNDSTLRTRRQVFESKSNKYDKEKSKEKGEPAPAKTQPRF